jgi:hypothetical protein
MSAIIVVQIACDHEDCYRAHTPTLDAAGWVGMARREAHQKGWVSVGSRGIKRRDYCPEHKP